MRCKPLYALIALALFLSSAAVPLSRPALAAPPPPGFHLEIAPTTNARYRALGDAFVKDGRMRAILALYTDQLVMPRVIPVRLRECGGVANAFYMPQSHEILLCYELLDAVYRAWEKVFAGDPAVGKPDVRGILPGLLVARTVNTTLFIAMHEVGHCLIHEFSFGYSGKEEDAVDDFATLAMLAMKQEQVAVDGGVAMALLTPLAKTRTLGIEVFWDAHAFGEQRYADIFCTIYGSDPAGHAAMVPTQIPAARASTCPKAYAAKSKFWNEKLAGMAHKN